MNDERVYDDVLSKLADGEAIDWDAVERIATPAERALLKQLRLLQRVGETHSSMPPGDEETGPTPELETGPLPGSETAPQAPLASEPSLEIGHRWGRYRLIGQIGRGSYGVVYLAQDEDLKRDIAIKLLHKRFAARADHVDRVKAEGRALARVRHENVLKVYDVEEHEHQLGLCMEYIDGRTLDDMVRADGPTNVDEAISIGQAVCRGLAAVHAAGVLHRDVKARNVMRERAGRFVLMDLGSGLEESTEGSASVQNVGTPLYMAPELLSGGTASRRSEVYAVGVLMYYLVTGTYPVTGETIDELRQAHRDRARTPVDELRPELPDVFVRLTERATAFDPAARHGSVVALLRDLNAAARGRSRGSNDPTSGGDTMPLPPSPLIVWARGIATAVLAVAVVALFSGLLTAYTFNAVIDRPVDFDPPQLGAMFGLGLQTLAYPTFVVALLLGIGAVLNLFFKVIPWPKRMWHSALHKWLSRSGLREEEYVGAMAQVAVLIGFLALVFAFFFFGDIAYSFVGTLSTSDLDWFSPLSFEYDARVRRIQYRATMSTLLVLVIVGWIRVRRVRLRRGGTVPTWVRIAGFSLMALLLTFSQAPYKPMVQNEMPVILLDGARCYRLGRNGDFIRVFCPAWNPPRVRTVTVQQQQDCGFDENVFLATRGNACQVPSP